MTTDQVIGARRGSRAVMRMIVTGIGACAVVAVAFAGLLLWWSPGKPRPVLGPDGQPAAHGIWEKVRIPVNGTEQGMFLRGADATKPVLLFVHGGPGMPEYFLDRTHPTGLEQDFIVAWWEQRGSGLSYAAGSDGATMTSNQLVEDTIAVADCLRSRFGQDRIYLLGHSWGSFIGIQAAARAPERFLAYLGMGQVSQQRRAEMLAHQRALETYAKAGDTVTVERLRAAPLTEAGPLPQEWLAMRDDVMHRIGIGTTRDMDSVITGVFVPVWQTPDYNVMEKIDVWRGKKRSQALLFERLLEADLGTLVPALEIPAYFLLGREDYTAGYPLAKAYFRGLSAPVKGFYTFEHSAHSPAFEEPGRMRQILQTDVLHARATMADAVEGVER